MKQNTRLPVFTHTVDANDVLTNVNDHWLRFAEENQVPQLTRPAVVGRPLWSFIAGFATIHIYKLLMCQVRQSQRRLVFTYRSDSPFCRRYMQMEIVPTADFGLEFRNYLLREESRDRVRLLDSTAERNGELLLMCGWCHRIRCEDAWLPIEIAIKTLGLFAPPELPQITHGICSDCMRSFKSFS